MKPSKTLWNTWGKCASFDLEDFKKSLRFVKIESPIEVDVVIHSKEHSSIPLELSTTIRLESRHVVNINVEKTIDIYQDKKPCYRPEDNKGDTYGDHEYKLLQHKIMDQFNCTTPFIPSEYRNGSKICSKAEKGERVNMFFKLYSSSLNFNMWSQDHHSIPPCVYHTFTAKDLKTEGK